MTLPTSQQVERLPKWARDHIRHLEDRAALADRVEALSLSEDAAMDLWWGASGDDWPVPSWLPAKYLRRVLRG